MSEQLDSIIRKYREKGGNIIFLLQETQEMYGYVPREAVDYFAEALQIAPSRFYGVATFYSQFRLSKPGRHKVTACCGTACHVRGAERIISGLERELGLGKEEDTTSDGAVTLDKVACLGTCSFAPVVLVNGEVRGKADLDGLLKEIRVLRKKE